MIINPTIQPKAEVRCTILDVFPDILTRLPVSPTQRGYMVIIIQERSKLRFCTPCSLYADDHVANKNAQKKNTILAVQCCSLTAYILIFLKRLDAFLLSPFMLLLMLSLSVSSSFDGCVSWFRLVLRTLV
jgi:hypothetical protein